MPFTIATFKKSGVKNVLNYYSFNSDAGSGVVLVTIGDGVGVSGIESHLDTGEFAIATFKKSGVKNVLNYYSFNSDAGSGVVLVTIGDGVGVSGIESHLDTEATGEFAIEEELVDAVEAAVAAADVMAVMCFNCVIKD